MSRRTARTGGIRFLHAAFRDETGRTFTEDEHYLDGTEAREAARRRRVLVHWYHAPVEDITGQQHRIDEELRDLHLEPVLFKTTATLYRDAADAVLVFERHH